MTGKNPKFWPPPPWREIFFPPLWRKNYPTPLFLAACGFWPAEFFRFRFFPADTPMAPGGRGGGGWQSPPPPGPLPRRGLNGWPERTSPPAPPPNSFWAPMGVVFFFRCPPPLCLLRSVQLWGPRDPALKKFPKTISLPPLFVFLSPPQPPPVFFFWGGKSESFGKRSESGHVTRLGAGKAPARGGPPNLAALYHFGGPPPNGVLGRSPYQLPPVTKKRHPACTAPLGDAPGSNLTIYFSA